MIANKTINGSQLLDLSITFLSKELIDGISGVSTISSYLITKSSAGHFMKFQTFISLTALITPTKPCA